LKEKLTKYSIEQTEFDKNGECQSRSFVDLPEYIDVKILNEDSDDFNVAIPICRCKVLITNNT
jgi:hypothetical protein